MSYVQYLGVTEDTMSKEDAVTGSLSQLQLALAGAVVPVEGAGTAFTPLLKTTDQSMLLEAERVSFFADPRELLASYAPRGEPLTLAARLTGTATSAFAPVTSIPSSASDWLTSAQCHLPSEPSGPGAPRFIVPVSPR